ncbi:MAG: winged helix DNA-binding protein [Acidobacteria bacterium]|nr:winged helix DNA-binding protein [Acidobacteriota bacterium]
MGRARTAELVNEFLGSAHLLASAVGDVVEKGLLGEVAGSELTFSQFKLLKLVALTDAHTIGDVAAFLEVSNAAASKAVDTLVRRGLLSRAEGEADRRAVQLSLTESSRRLLAAYDTAKNRKLVKVFRRFSLAQLRRTAELLDRLSASIVDHHTGPEQICRQCGIYFREKCLVRQLTRRTCFYQRHKGRKNRHRASGLSPRLGGSKSK